MKKMMTFLIAASFLVTGWAHAQTLSSKASFAKRPTTSSCFKIKPPVKRCHYTAMKVCKAKMAVIRFASAAAAKAWYKKCVATYTRKCLGQFGDCYKKCYAKVRYLKAPEHVRCRIFLSCMKSCVKPIKPIKPPVGPSVPACVKKNKFPVKFCRIYAAKTCRAKMAVIRFASKAAMDAFRKRCLASYTRKCLLKYGKCRRKCYAKIRYLRASEAARCRIYAACMRACMKK